MNIAKSNRNKFYDAIKGVAILLVVIGHVIQNHSNDFDNNLIFRIIYSFHMPLFMFISGVVVTLGREVDVCWLKRKAQQLVVPFVVWIFLPFLFSTTKDWDRLICKIANVIKNPDNGYWFLWILFLCCFCLWISTIIQKKCMIEQEGMIFLAEVIILFLIGEKVTSWFGIKSLAYHSVYYFIGYMVGKYQLVRKIENNKIAIGLGVTIYVILVSMWYRTQLPAWLYSLEELLPNLFIRLMNLGFDYLVGLSGIFTIWVFVKYVLVKAQRILSVLGKSTLEIYVLHYYFIGMFRTGNIVFTMIINSILAIVLSLVIAKCIESGKVTRLLFGRCSNNK